MKTAAKSRQKQPFPIIDFDTIEAQIREKVKDLPRWHEAEITIRLSRAYDGPLIRIDVAPKDRDAIFLLGKTADEAIEKILKEI